MSFTEAEERVLKSLAAGMLKALARDGAQAQAPAPPPAADELPDSFLDQQPWADRTIKKDPTRWAGAPMVGRLYSEAPSEWHECMASFCDWKALQGAAENPPRLQTKGKNAGKPWHEAETFEARVCRAWARRNRGKVLPPGGATKASEPSDADSDWVP